MLLLLQWLTLRHRLKVQLHLLWDWLFLRLLSFSVLRLGLGYLLYVLLYLPELRTVQLRLGSCVAFWWRLFLGRFTLGIEVLLYHLVWLLELLMDSVQHLLELLLKLLLNLLFLRPRGLPLYSM